MAVHVRNPEWNFYSVPCAKSLLAPKVHCLNCGGRKRNVERAFCSADCCRFWRAHYRAEGGHNVRREAVAWSRGT